MRRWNGWGDDRIDYPLPETAVEYLAERIGSGDVSQDASLESILDDVPASQLPDHPLVKVDPFDRLKHARGQSLPDWVAMKTGKIGRYPDGVAYPAGNLDVHKLMRYVQDCQGNLIAYGGGTSVVGHINPGQTANPVLCVDLSQMNKLLDLDTVSHLATIEAGACGPEIERQLRQQGFTLGHYPQSFELSTLGGWIATRSSGQQSYYYGRIEDLFAGGHLESPVGSLDLPSLPASAAGPDLRQLVLGSEGRFGLITRAVVRVRLIPQFESFYGVFFHNWQDGMDAVRQIAQEHLPVSMARLSNAQETETTLILSGKTRLVNWADRGLCLLKYGPEKCLLVYGITGDEETHQDARDRVGEVIRRTRGLDTGKTAGRAWQKSRFLSPYLRNTLWSAGYAIDTLETALPWRKIPAAVDAITHTIRVCQENASERVLVLCHLSHIYQDGASIYVTYLFRRMPDPEQTLQQWKEMKSAASQAILTFGGTISHQHGVGSDHKPYLGAEKGSFGIEILQKISRSFDPNGILNPGKLVD
ncbi:MAG: FAD-linked oxidase [Chloroflexi bacterium RBG_16_54_18]|nr:MAG: FAD-linked oxidase [Chloroflexi bacterium RBG_16_54_18]